MTTELKTTTLRNAVGLCHLFLRQRVREGDRVLDATCGNGHDTLLLAGLVGPAGRVWGFDMQAGAIAATRELLAREGLLERVELLQSGHERLAELVKGPLAAVVFNLGYLPGGDKSLITRPETTLPALEAALELLAPGGILLVVVYPGHPGGAAEAAAVDSWGGELAPEIFHLWSCRQSNRAASSPYLLLVERSSQ